MSFRFLVLWAAFTPFNLFAAPPDCADPGTLRFIGESPYGTTYVVDRDGVRTLRFGSPCGHDQSALLLDDPTAVPTEYLRIATLGLALAERHDRILMLGLGGGTWTNMIARALPEARLDSVDIDPVVAEAAQRFFNVTLSDRYQVYIMDAAVFARTTGERYDIVFLDLYTAEGMPAHLKTREFFQTVAGLLQPGGVVIANLGLDHAANYLRLAARLRDATGEIICVSAQSETNLVVFAGAGNTMDPERLKTRADILDAGLGLPFSLAPVAARARQPCS